MGKTYRKQPSSGSYHKRQHHIGYRKLENSVEEEFGEYPAIKHHNRISSSKNRIPNLWDDEIISEYRGQDWYRDR